MHLNNGRADKKRNGIHSHISLTNSPNQIGLEVQSLNLQETDGALLLDIPDFMVLQLISFATVSTTGKTNGKTAACKGNL